MQTGLSTLLNLTMPERPEMPQVTDEENEKLCILQLNLNKSEKAHLEIINERLSSEYDIILIQEPYTTIFNVVRMPTNFRPVFPLHRFQSQEQIRSVIWVNKKIDTKNWTILDIPGSNDLTAIQLEGPYGKISIFNIYNNCTHSRNETALRQFIHEHTNDILATENHHMIWAGDFNRHHPLWDDDEDTHLFTSQVTRMAEGLIELLATYDLVMSLPKGIPTLQHMVTKRYSRPDNFFATPTIGDLITQCEVIPSLRPTSTDHFPIVTNILLPQARIQTPPTHNFREADWDSFRRKLKHKLNATPESPAIHGPEDLAQTVSLLTTAIQETIAEEIPKTKPRPDSKRWWNGDLKKMKKEIDRLRALSYNFRAIANHHSHSKLRRLSNQYGEAIVQAKRQHWTTYLEEMNAADIWTANKFIREPAGDGGSPRIPTLKTKNEAGMVITVNSNEDKANLFAKTFFPPPPPPPEIQEHHEYPEPLPDPPQLTMDQLIRHIYKMAPYKAHGPDGIPNIVLQKCADVIAPRLLCIYRAILQDRIYFEPQKEFTTVVLRKPGKPSYEVPKAYRPIALISTMAKVLTSVVAENLSQLVEQHRLLPRTHFEGRPGRSTVDAVHYLVHKIRSAWRTNKVVSVLFLDVEGAFPNAVTARLIHNLKMRRIPVTIVNFVELLLANRKTRLKFDDFISGIIDIANGIGQGDPLSMLLYILYNADLLELPEDTVTEDALGYVDDIALLTVGDDLEETTQKLQNLMTKQGGGLHWSTLHNSRFEVTKSAILHFSRKSIPDPDSDGRRIPLPKPPLVLEGQVVQEVTSYKYLGIQIDYQLKWKEQAQCATANATKWLLQFRRLTKISTGVKSKLMRQLYLAVALPKITYGIDVWYTPPTKPAGFTRNTGSICALKNLQKAQRIATLAIMGTLRTSPNDFIDIHSGIYPMELALLKACHSAMVCLLTLPDTHPLYQIIREAKRQLPFKHLIPIDSHLKLFALTNTKVETIQPAVCLPRRERHYFTKIDSDREDSINYEIHDDADYKAFSDGSGQDNGIGAAAILYKKNRARPLKSLQFYLGTTAQHNTYEAEAAGALLALWLIRTTPETLGKKVTLYIDNQSIITATTSQKASPGQYLLESIRLAANTSGSSLTLRWISSHSNVKGNEAVDKMAKDAAEGRSSTVASLPHLFRNPLPTSASALKQEYNANIKTKWSDSWNTSPRKPRLDQFGGTFPFGAFLKKLNSLTRKQSSIILQLRCGHFPLNAYLHKISKVESSRCQACAEHQEDDPPPESINHFLFDSPAHHDAREDLVNKIGRHRFHLSDIMSDTDRMKALVTYINRTGRLRT